VVPPSAMNDDLDVFVASQNLRKRRQPALVRGRRRDGEACVQHAIKVEEEHSHRSRFPPVEAKPRRDRPPSAGHGR
jgi:hypothetical protein